MKVLQLVNAQQRRGAEIFAVQLSDALRRLGVDVRVVALYRSPLQLDRDKLDLGPEGRCFGYASGSLMERLFTVDPRLVLDVYKFLEDWQPDILQMNGGSTAKYGVFSSLCLKRKPILVYRKIGGLIRVHKFPWKQYYRQMLRKVHGIVAVSHFDLVEWQNFSIISPTTRLAVIPNAIDPASLKSCDSVRSEESKIVNDDILLFVGRFTREKCPECALQILRYVAKVRNVQLWFVGDGPLRKFVLEKAKYLGVISRVRFWGVQDCLVPFYRRAKVLLLTSVIEGIPAVVLEAGYWGIPVVATRVGGIPECVRDGETGFLFEYGNWKQGAESILKLLQDESLRQRMGNAASAWIRSRFLMDHVAKEYLNFYEDLIKTRHSDSH